MLEMAEGRRTLSDLEVREKMEFQQGDIREIDLHEQYDVVLSLFHVMSYQTTNEDLVAVFRSAKKHLKSGGVFLFDCWYGPGVLSDPPVTRVKRLEDETCKIVRLAEPEMHPNENLDDVNYQIIIEDKETGSVESIKEQHKMRFLFRPEIEMALMASGMEIIDYGEWMTGNIPSEKSWCAYFVVG